MIQVYFSRQLIEWDKELKDYWMSYLSFQDQERYNRYQKMHDIQLGVVGRILLSIGLEANRIPCSIKDIQCHNHKKPYLENGPYFNISHSGDLVVCSVSSETDHGIDIEKSSEINFDSFEKCFTEREWKYINQSPKDSLFSFYRMWTRKEAVVKAQGCGLSQKLDEFEAVDDYTTLKNRSWYLSEIELDKHYCCSLAMERSVPVLLKCVTI